MTPSDEGLPKDESSSPTAARYDVLEYSSYDSEHFDAIMDRTVFPLTEDEFRQFEELLDSAPEPNEALRTFLRQRPPWDREP